MIAKIHAAGNYALSTSRISQNAKFEIEGVNSANNGNLDLMVQFNDKKMSMTTRYNIEDVEFSGVHQKKLTITSDKAPVTVVFWINAATYTPTGAQVLYNKDCFACKF